MTSKDASNWQATQNQMFKCHFSASGNLKRNIACKAAKRHLQAMDGAPGTILVLHWARPRLARWCFVRYVSIEGGELKPL